MPITIVTAATATDLCLVTDLPASVRGANSTNDALLAPMITRASALIRRYCRRHFERQTYSERLPAFGRVNLALMTEQTSLGLWPGGPLTTVDSVTLTDSDTASSGTTYGDYLVRNLMAGTLYRQNGWDWTAQLQTDLGFSIAPGSERPRWLVQYTAGYLLPTTTSDGTLPQDVRMACLEHVGELWNRAQRDPSIARISIPGDVDITYRAEAGSGGALGGAILTPAVREMLSEWRLEW